MTQYYFTVQTYYQQQRSSANHISAYTSDMPVNISRILPAPVNLMVTNRTESSITLQWNTIQDAQVILVLSTIIMLGKLLTNMVTKQFVIDYDHFT